MELVTDRLLLREFRAGDHAAAHGYCADPEVTRYTDWGPNSPEDTTAFLAEVAREPEVSPRAEFTLAIVDRTGGELIGSAALSVESRAHRRGTMGYVLARSRWGRGYATEAAAAMLRFGFGALALHRITATCDPDNVASARVLAKVGMSLEGHLRGHLYVRGRWRDRLLFGALSPDGTGS